MRRYHCEVELDGLTPVLFNLSTKGTLLNDRKVIHAKVMKNGDKITVARGETFILHNMNKKKIIETANEISSDSEIENSNKGEKAISWETDSESSKNLWMNINSYEPKQYSVPTPWFNTEKKFG